MKNKVAIVTGSSRGIGKAIALMLAEQGMKVVVTYNTELSKANDVLDKIKSFGGECMVEQFNAGNRKSIKNLVSRVVEKYKTVDVLINNAAIAQEKPFGTITDDDWEKMMAVNLQCPFIFSQEIVPFMIKNKWGRIVNIVSIGGQWGGFNQVHYAAAKAGLINLTRSLAKIYSKDGINVNAVSPGLVMTDMSSNELNTSAGLEKVKNIPIGRIARPEEIASVVKFLCSEDSSYITGQTINVNGGMYFV